MKASSSRTLDMTTGSPLRLLLAFALPIFLGNLLQQFYNLADTALAGHILGDAALAQIGATAALYSLLTSLAIGITNGFALLISHAFGCQDEPRLRQASCQMVLWTGILAALLTVGFLLAVRPLLVLKNAGRYYGRCPFLYYRNPGRNPPDSCLQPGSQYAAGGGKQPCTTDLSGHFLWI